jgi:zinc transporter ZupT
MKYVFPFVSVIIGYGIAYFIQPKDKKNIKLLLAFSGSFLLSLTVMHLLPELYENSSSDNIGIYIMLGIVFQILLEFFSKGAEHGHVHGHNKLHQIPWLLFVSLCIHAFIEGFAINQNERIAVGIAIHHLPIAIILTTFFINAKLSTRGIAIVMICFALMTPLGTLAVSGLPFLLQFQSQLVGVVVGILFHISSTIIFESSEEHTFNIAKLTMIFLGILIACFL